MRRSRLLSCVCSIGVAVGAAALALLVVFATVAQAVRALQIVASADEREARDDDDARDEQGSDDADVSPELFKVDTVARRGGRTLPPRGQLIAIMGAPVTRPRSPSAAPSTAPPLESFVRLQL